jgi:hypothetical protein
VRLLAKNILRAIALVILPLLASLLIRLLYFTNKKEFHSPKSIGDKPTIFAVWHGDLLMLAYIHRQYRKITRAKVLISDHFDGLLISKTIKYFGFDTIAGSTNRNAARVLIQGIKSIKEGYDIGITPDGPRGPRHSVSDGVIVMAQKTKAKIVLVNIKPSSYWKLNSWDKFTIPKPFGKIDFYSTEPIDVVGLDLEEARDLIQKGLLKHEA